MRILFAIAGLLFGAGTVFAQAHEAAQTSVSLEADFRIETESTSALDAPVAPLPQRQAFFRALTGFVMSLPPWIICRVGYRAVYEVNEAVADPYSAPPEYLPLIRAGNIFYWAGIIGGVYSAGLLVNLGIATVRLVRDSRPADIR